MQFSRASNAMMLILWKGSMANCLVYGFLWCNVVFVRHFRVFTVMLRIEDSLHVQRVQSGMERMFKVKTKIRIKCVRWCKLPTIDVEVSTRISERNESGHPKNYAVCQYPPGVYNNAAYQLSLPACTFVGTIMDAKQSWDVRMDESLDNTTGLLWFVHFFFT